MRKRLENGVQALKMAAQIYVAKGGVAGPELGPTKSLNKWKENYVHVYYQKDSPTATKSRECAVSYRFWNTFDKMQMICYPTLLHETKHGYHTLSQNRKNSQRSGDIQVHQNRKSLSNLLTRLEKCWLSFFAEEKGAVLIDFMDCWSRLLLICITKRSSNWDMR